jgi:predicted N-acetyltransferase YhbS
VTQRIHCRPARESELPELGELAHGAFQLGSVEGWQRWLSDNPHRRPEDVTVALWEGRPVGVAVALRLTLALAGRDVPLRGVAGVGVHPAYRQRGVGDALMRSCLDALRAQGTALSMLYPFKLSFYRRYGYGLSELLELFSGPPRTLPSSPLRAHVEPLPPTELPAVKALYDQARASATGPLQRSDWWWEKRVLARTARGMIYRDPDTRALGGYLLYEVPTEPSYPRQTLRVRELYTLTTEARRGLLGALHGLRDQYARCELCLPQGVLKHLVTDFPAPDVGAPWCEQDLLGTVAVGAMARVLDLPRALAAHPFAARDRVHGTVGLDLQDPCFGTSSWDVTLDPNGITAVEGSRAPQRLSLGVEVFSPVYLGGESALDALRRGDAEGSSQAATLLDQALGGPVPFLGLQNHF